MKPGSDYESLDSYFSRLRDKVEHAEQDYPRLTSVKNGDSILVEIVNEYEDRFYKLLNHRTVLFDKLRIRRLGNRVVEYTQDLEQFIEGMDSLSGRGFSSYNPSGSYRKQKSSELDKVFCGSGIVGGVVAMLLPFFFPLLPVLPALALLFGGAAGGFVSACGLDSSYVDKSAKYDAENFFDRLREYSRTVEKEIHIAYMWDYFVDNIDLFKEVYREIDESDRYYVNTKLIKMQGLGLFDMRSNELEFFLDECVKDPGGE